MQFARTEGIIPAPESAHAIRAAIDEALRCKKEGKRKTILFNLSGHGHFDLGAYEAYLAGKLPTTSTRPRRSPRRCAACRGEGLGRGA